MLLAALIFCGTAANAQNKFDSLQAVVLDRARLHDSGVYYVKTIEFRRTRPRRVVVSMRYTTKKGDASLHSRKHRTRYRDEGKFELIKIRHPVAKYDPPERVSIIRKINGAYAYVRFTDARLLVNQYLLFQGKPYYAHEQRDNK